MSKKSNGNDKIPDDMTEKEMVVKIMHLTTKENMSDKKLRKILDYILKVSSEPED
jgi:hypothetical protein